MNQFLFDFTYVGSSSAANGERYKPLQKVVSFQDFLYVEFLVRSRYFLFSIENQETNIILPVIEMINHKYGQEANLSGVFFNRTHAILIAARNIEKGEEVFFNYNVDTGHRVDIIFGTYGYVMEQDPPLLFATDLPDFEQRKLAGSYPLTDDIYYGPNGAFNFVEEYLRLQGLLKSMPTSIEDDERILAAIKPEDWQDAEIVTFRLARKRALSQAINNIIINK